jgi:hypothetical protein
VTSEYPAEYATVLNNDTIGVPNTLLAAGAEVAATVATEEAASVVSVEIVTIDGTGTTVAEAAETTALRLGVEPKTFSELVGREAGVSDMTSPADDELLGTAEPPPNRSAVSAVATTAVEPRPTAIVVESVAKKILGAKTPITASDDVGSESVS